MSREDPLGAVQLENRRPSFCHVTCHTVKPNDEVFLAFITGVFPTP